MLKFRLLLVGALLSMLFGCSELEQLMAPQETSTLPACVQDDCNCSDFTTQEEAQAVLEAFYAPLLREFLQAFEGAALELTLDTSLRWERFCLVEVCLIWGGRSLSLAQTVLEHGSAMVGFEQYRPLLETARYSIAAGLYHDLACRPRRVNIES